MAHKAIQEWIEISQYDLQTAEAMFDSGRYLYVVFMCQQAVEKILKAIYVQKKNELPPRTHNLLYLVDILKLDIDESKRILFAQLNQFYLESRYPGERNRLAKEMDKNKSLNYLNKTKQAWKCLKQIFL
ncbi:MAG: HEPN domain-containing protein [Candidatus Omnitrophica bacterium]|nr:HEPN domain-containing protein [Candidatus Omnitrophota bacterium]MBU0896467.1 HEPN domain-containing protein [Candidatus Omnitrophota bacterium]MBU1133374.1 HEPN domain-containing protein [Candidatus Omnitrophota bacterium]MBU1367706.1 HEPN domain-containing protein [Candidatus Omnitrophota bacterium]MBU1523334.1 HEPN domain-containing protein [Candidatus Omnitrophota bacterium]